MMRTAPRIDPCTAAALRRVGPSDRRRSMHLIPPERGHVAKAKVTFQPTPNPQAGKFTVDRVLVEGRRGKTYDSVDAAAGVPLAERLLAEPGVRSVFMVADFVTVTKAPEADWKELSARVKAVLRAVL